MTTLVPPPSLNTRPITFRMPRRRKVSWQWGVTSPPLHSFSLWSERHVPFSRHVHSSGICPACNGAPYKPGGASPGYGGSCHSIRLSRFECGYGGNCRSVHPGPRSHVRCTPAVTEGHDRMGFGPSGEFYGKHLPNDGRGGQTRGSDQSIHRVRPSPHFRSHASTRRTHARISSTTRTRARASLSIPPTPPAKRPGPRQPPTRA